ncbi:MAG: FKBP-type peptidyl-prolyl cis-trans isomerase [Bacteroidales bacterium]|nr:FKBP-type peptidyl-prolyl cis-trans isomerase [Bacteroidales bacterium]
MKLRFAYILILSLLIIVFACNQKQLDTDSIVLKTRMDTISYIIGLDYGDGIRQEGIKANRLAIYKGLADGLDSTSVLSDSVKEALIASFDEELKKKLADEQQHVLEQNKIEGAKFMEENLSDEGVMETGSGLQYKILKEGTGSKPAAGDSVLVHYRAMFINRDVFDMSYDRGPAGIRLNKIIPGLSEGIRLMHEGSIYELYIPPELAYGDKPFANVIPPGSTLIYSIELIKIVK